VMEKCTFCVQRLEQAKIARKVKAGASGDVVVEDGGALTACQQACPAEAITFGNLRDSHSEVSQARGHERTYMVLDYLTTKPRVTYLARVRNPNPDMPDTYDMPLSTREFLDHGGMLHGHAADAHGEVGRVVPGAPGEVGRVVPGAPPTTPGTPGTEAAAPAGQKGAH